MPNSFSMSIVLLKPLSDRNSVESSLEEDEPDDMLSTGHFQPPPLDPRPPPPVSGSAAAVRVGVRCLGSLG
jgi:hypothetical protein